MQIYSINPNYTNTKLNNRRSERVQKTTTFETAELSGCKAGRAILAQNNISFRNLDRPVEVTHLYNKKTEGKDHLDLPNIHVYEFPDTNLKAFVNADKNIKTDEKSVLNSPKIQIFVENLTHNDSDLLKEKFLFTILKNKFKTLSDDVNFNDNNADFSYNQFFIIESIENFAKYNNFIFNLKMSNSDIQTAKNEIIEYIDKTDIEKDDEIKLLYGKEHFKTKQELLNEIKNITPKEMTTYYANYKNNLSMQAFITISEDYFNENKDKLFSIINSNISCKLQNTGNITSDFSPNKQLLTVKSCTNYDSLNFPVKLVNTKDDLISDIAAMLLNNNKIFSQYYNISFNYFDLPFNFKGDIPKKEDNKYYTIKLKDNFNDKTLENYQLCLSKICETPLKTELDDIKDIYKNRLKTTFTGDRLDIIKAQELVKYCDDIYNLYELIDSITEEDIKEFINIYFLAQEPIIAQRFKNYENNHK